METTVDFEPEAYEVARTRAAERGQSLGKVLGDAILGYHSVLPKQEAQVETDDQGWPVIRTGRSFTLEETRAMREEDETWEITRGDPHHPFHKPVVTTDEQGFPQVEIGRPLTLEVEQRGRRYCRTCRALQATSSGPTTSPTQLSRSTASRATNR